MKKAYSVERVRAAESAAMATQPSGALMQRAAAGLAAAIARTLGRVYAARVLLLVGSGDNGGDALYAGAMLARRGARVEALLLSTHVHESGSAALLAAGGRIVTSPGRADVVVDGIVGIGGRGGLRQEAAAAVAALADVPVVAVDLPSGVNADHGTIDGPHVRADLTVTFGCLKPVHLLDPDGACGRLELVDLALDLGQPDIEALEPSDVAPFLHIGREAHKYTRGVVGLLTGSEQYPGAAVLGAGGALAGLAGMVRYAGSAVPPVLAAHPEVVPGEGRVQAWVVGSGSGPDARASLARALEDDVPVVVDADALACATPDARQVLTPHAGELAAIRGATRDAVEAAPLEAARDAASAYRCVVLLKGRRTVVAAPDGRVRVNTSGTPWLATAGSGDVLAGLVGSLLAGGLDPFDAASVGAWLHGAAAERIGGPLRARELPDAIAAVVRDPG